MSTIELQGISTAVIVTSACQAVSSSREGGGVTVCSSMVESNKAVTVRWMKGC